MMLNFSIYIIPNSELDQILVCSIVSTENATEKSCDGGVCNKKVSKHIRKALDQDLIEKESRQFLLLNMLLRGVP